MSAQMRKRGRKVEQAARLTALIEAAEAVFLQKGYHAATMNDVAKAAGMSKKTVYELVESKIDLFFSILADHHEKINFPPPEPGWDAADVLTANLLCLGRFLLAPAQIALIRLIMAEYTHSPDFGREFLRNRVVRAKARLETTLVKLACPELSPAQAKEMSALLFGMALGEFHTAALIGFRPPPSRAALEARVRRAVDIFLAGCGARGAETRISLPSGTCGGPPRDV